MNDNSVKTMVMQKKDELTQSASAAAEKAAAVATEIGETTVATVKKYPLHSALAAGAAGLIAGVFAARSKK